MSRSSSSAYRSAVEARSARGVHSSIVLGLASLVLLAVIGTGCGGDAQTPRELYDRLRSSWEGGNYVGIVELLTPESVEAIESVSGLSATEALRRQIPPPSEVDAAANEIISNYAGTEPPADRFDRLSLAIDWAVREDPDHELLSWRLPYLLALSLPEAQVGRRSRAAQVQGGDAYTISFELGTRTATLVAATTEDSGLRLTWPLDGLRTNAD